MINLHFIMPVGLDTQYKQKISIIQKLATQFNISIILPLVGNHSPEFDLITLMNQLQQTDFVVVDLSYERPSCYYELGIAETLGKKIQIIATFGTHIHQTSNKSHAYIYNNLGDYENYLVDLMRRLTGLGADAKRG